MVWATCHSTAWGQCEHYPMGSQWIAVVRAADKTSYCLIFLSRPGWSKIDKNKLLPHWGDVGSPIYKTAKRDALQADMDANYDMLSGHSFSFHYQCYGWPRCQRYGHKEKDPSTYP